jgi:hypothetical protein
MKMRKRVRSQRISRSTDRAQLEVTLGSDSCVIRTAEDFDVRSFRSGGTILPMHLHRPSYFARISIHIASNSSRVRLPFRTECHFRSQPTDQHFGSQFQTVPLLRRYVHLFLAPIQCTFVSGSCTKLVNDLDRFQHRKPILPVPQDGLALNSGFLQIR